MQKKLKTGWFTFSCSEDSTMMFLELLGYRFSEWKDLMDFRYFKALRTISSVHNLDVAFVEGAISSEEDIKKLKEIRENCKYLVAIGSCACQGKPSAMRNYFSPEQKQKISKTIKKFGLTDKVYCLKELVKVDYEVPGCPMIEDAFVKTFTLCLISLESNAKKTLQNT